MVDPFAQLEDVYQICHSRLVRRNCESGRVYAAPLGRCKQISCLAYLNRGIDHHQFPAQQLLDLPLAEVARPCADKRSEVQCGISDISRGELFHFRGLSVLFPATSPAIHQLAGIAPAMFINYFLNSYWTFKHAPQAINNWDRRHGLAKGPSTAPPTEREGDTFDGEAVM